MRLQLIALPGAEEGADRLARALAVDRCALAHRRFPDGETYLRVDGEVAGDTLAIVAALREPDPQIPALLFLADALRELGAVRVGLVAPYLPYMRQDTRFQPGEAISSRSFAKLVSRACDWLVTADPHLHRYPSLAALYDIPARAVASAPAIAAWVRAEVAQPCIVGPDAESLQWVQQVAALAGCPFSVLAKRRLGDRAIEQVPLDDLSSLHGCTPVLVDDIIASGHSMAGAVRLLRAQGFAPPVCIGVHALFSGDAASVLQAAGAARVVSCNSLPHESNEIDLTSALAEAIGTLAPAGAS